MKHKEHNRSNPICACICLIIEIPREIMSLFLDILKDYVRRSNISLRIVCLIKCKAKTYTDD